MQNKRKIPSRSRGKPEERDPRPQPWEDFVCLKIPLLELARLMDFTTRWLNICCTWEIKEDEASWKSLWGWEPCSENTTWLQLLQADKFCSTIQTHLSNPFYLLSERMFNAQINISSDSDKAAKMSTVFALQLAQGG